MLEGRFGVLLFLYSVLLTKVLIVIVTLTYSYMYTSLSWPYLNPRYILTHPRQNFSLKNQYNIMQISDENKTKYQKEDNSFLYNIISLYNS